MTYKLGELVKIRTGKLDANASSENGAYPFFTCSVNHLMIDDYAYDCECVLVAGNGDLNVKYYYGKFNAYQRTYIIESLNKEKLSMMYLYYFMSKYVEILRHGAIGGVIKYIKLSNLTDARIPLPPLSEQKRIVAILDKAQQLIDLRKQQLAKLDELIQSIFYDMFGDPVTNPKGWEVKKLAKVAPIIQSTFSEIPNKVWLLNLDMVEKDTGNIIDFNIVNIDEVGSSTICFNEDNVLYSKLRPYLNKVVVPQTSGFSSSEMIPLKPDVNILGRLFLAYSLRCKEFVKYISGKVSGAKMPRVVLKDFKKFQLPVPPVSLQKQFTTKVEKIEEQKKIMQQSLVKLEENFKALQQRAFRGHL